MTNPLPVNIKQTLIGLSVAHGLTEREVILGVHDSSYTNFCDRLNITHPQTIQRARQLDNQRGSKHVSTH